GCGTVATFSTSATDACDPAPAIAFTPPSGSLFPVGVTTVKGKATDACGNVDSCTFTVTVQATSPPCAITGPSQTCAGTPVQLCAPAGAFTYRWTGPSFSDTSRCVAVGAAGTYQLVVTDPAT